MSATSSKFSYGSLGQSEIRCITVRDPPTEVYLEGNLSRTSRRGGGYTALSYEWGSNPPSVDRKMVVSRSGYVPLTQNLWWALRNLATAFPDTNKKYFIDQICIDQDDNGEKAVQVAEMGDVYRYADQVVTYLGRAKDTDGAALKLLDRIDDHFGSWFERELNEDFDMLDRVARQGQAPGYLKRFKDDMSASDEEALEDLYKIVYQSGWTRRLWMLQENVLNRKVVYLRGGKILSRRSVHLLPFCVAFGFLPRPEGVEVTDFMNALRVADSYRDIQQKDEKEPLIKIINEFAPSFACKDPKDKIYAVLGLADAEMEITPDYNADNFDVYKDFVLKCIEDTATLHIFDNIHQNSTGSSFDNVQLTWPTNKRYWPSWVPTFKQGAPPRIQGSASGTTYAQVTNSDLHLSIKGFQVETIDSVIGTFDSDAYITPTTSTSVIEGICITLSRALGELQSKGDRNAASTLCYTLITSDTCLGDSSKSHEYWTRWSGIAMNEILNNFAEAWRIDISDLHKGSASYFSSRILPRFNIANRSLCMTKSGKLLLGPKATMAGDRVVVLLGGDPLYVIRYRGSNADTYDLLGPAYCHGYMDGEALYTDKWLSEIVKVYDQILGDDYVDLFKMPIVSWSPSAGVKLVRERNEEWRPKVRNMCGSILSISMSSRSGLFAFSNDEENISKYRNSSELERRAIMLKAITKGPFKASLNKTWRKDFWNVFDLKFKKVFPQPPFQEKLQTYKFT